MPADRTSGCVSNAVDLYVGAAWFECWPGYPLSFLRLCVVFLFLSLSLSLTHTHARMHTRARAKVAKVMTVSFKIPSNISAVLPFAVRRWHIQ